MEFTGMLEELSTKIKFLIKNNNEQKIFNLKQFLVDIYEEQVKVRNILLKSQNIIKSEIIINEDISPFIKFSSKIPYLSAIKVEFFENVLKDLKLIANHFNLNNFIISLLREENVRIIIPNINRRKEIENTLKTIVLEINNKSQTEQNEIFFQVAQNEALIQAAYLLDIAYFLEQIKISKGKKLEQLYEVFQKIENILYQFQADTNYFQIIINGFMEEEKNKFKRLVMKFNYFVFLHNLEIKEFFQFQDDITSQKEFIRKCYKIQREIKRHLNKTKVKVTDIVLTTPDASTGAISKKTKNNCDFTDAPPKSIILHNAIWNENREQLSEKSTKVKTDETIERTKPVY